MITGIYVKTIVTNKTIIIPPLLMQIFRLKYDDPAWGASNFIELNYDDTRSLQATLRTATVLLPLTNLEKEKQDDFLKKLEDMILQLRERDNITIQIKSKL